jgi:hypothetical protein
MSEPTLTQPTHGVVTVVVENRFCLALQTTLQHLVINYNKHIKYIRVSPTTLNKEQRAPLEIKLMYNAILWIIIYYEIYR